MFTKGFEDYHLHKTLWISVNVYIPLINYIISSICVTFDMAAFF